MFNRTLVTVRDENVNSVAPPAFTNDVTATAAPDENTNDPPVTRSSTFGRSYNTTRSIVTGEDHTNWIHDPALPPTVAHSRVASPGYPDATPSTAFTADCPVDVFCDDADTLTPAARATFPGAATADTPGNTTNTDASNTNATNTATPRRPPTSSTPARSATTAEPRRPNTMRRVHPHQEPQGNHHPKPHHNAPHHRNAPSPQHTQPTTPTNTKHPRSGGRTDGKNGTNVPLSLRGVTRWVPLTPRAGPPPPPAARAPCPPAASR